VSDLFRAQLEASIGQLRALTRRGNELTSASDPELRIWQRDCAALINELSGGSKAHWLSRAYSEALLVRSSTGTPADASPNAIVARVIALLERAIQSLSDPAAASRVAAGAQPEPHRFDFVHDEPVRPVLEQAFASSREALDAGDFEGALKTTCGILEAIITDALSAFARTRAAADKRHDEIGNAMDFTDRTFSERIAAAEEAALIRNGCARLTAAARAYRDVPFVETVTERDARVAMQVLRVVMRDLDPGR
jgi:hypothetical protein